MILVHYREVTQMDTLGSIYIVASYQVLVNILCHEGDHGCCCLTDGHQCGVQRHVGIDLILLHTLCPETLTAASYIPVTHLIDEVLQSLGSLGNTVLVQIAVYFCNGRVQLGQQPLIHYGQFVVFQCIFGSIKIINVCIQYEECVGIPQGTHEFTLSFLYGLAGESLRQPGCGTGVEIPADGICTVGLQCVERIYRIALTLTHLLTVLILYMAHNDNVLVRSLVEEQSGFCQQRVEPSTGLVHCLGDKVSRELLLEQILIFKRIMMLCKRHCSGVEPAVDHLGNTLHLLAALGAGDGDLVDVRTMEFYGLRLLIAAHLVQLFPAADGVLMSAFALPDI